MLSGADVFRRIVACEFSLTLADLKRKYGEEVVKDVVRRAMIHFRGLPDGDECAQYFGGSTAKLEMSWQTPKELEPAKRVNASKVMRGMSWFTRVGETSFEKRARERIASGESSHHPTASMGEMTSQITMRR